MSDRATLGRVSTGDDVLDHLLGGGLPEGSLTVLAGKPGSGKTVLALQVLFHAARAGKRCVYFATLAEPAIRVLRYMQQFEFFDADLVDKHIFFVDLGAAARDGSRAALEKLTAIIEEHEPAFVAIDSYRAMGDFQRMPEQARSITYDLSVHLIAANATTLLVGEYTSEELGTAPELAVADGLIELGSFRENLTSTRGVEIIKMRGADFITGQHFYDITSAGLVFFPRVRGPHGRGKVSDQRASTGLTELDDMLGGGIPRGSATVVQGGAGTGKTLLTMQIALAGALGGEPVVFFTLEETADQLRSHARRVGWDLDALEASGALTIDYTSPVELSTDRYLHHVRGLMASTGARRVAFDSLSTMALGVPSERRFKELAYALSMHAREAGATIVMTMEAQQLLGAGMLSAHGVSFVADNLIQLRYVELEGRIARALSILKARGSQHSTEAAALEIASTGLRVVQGAFKDLRRVHTGLPEHES